MVLKERGYKRRRMKDKSWEQGNWEGKGDWEGKRDIGKAKKIGKAKP